MKTKVVSARVPVDIAKMIENTCKQRNVSKSTYISELVTTPVHPTMAKGGNVEPPGELVKMLSVIGGVGVGILTWNILQKYLPDDKFDDRQKNTISLIASIGAGMFGLLAINKISKR